VHFASPPSNVSCSELYSDGNLPFSKYILCLFPVLSCVCTSSLTSSILFIFQGTVLQHISLFLYPFPTKSSQSLIRYTDNLTNVCKLNCFHDYLSIKTVCISSIIHSTKTKCLLQPQHWVYSSKQPRKSHALMDLIYASKNKEKINK